MSAAATHRAGSPSAHPGHFDGAASSAPRAAAAAQRPLHPGGVWMSQTDTGDIDELASAQPEWQQRYEQIGRGRFAGRLRHVQLPGMRMVHEESNLALRQHGDLGQGAYGFAMPLHMDGEAIFHGQRVAADAVMVGRGDVLDLVTPNRFALIGVVVDAGLLEPVWQQLYLKPPSPWLESQRVLPGRPAASLALRQHHLQAMQRLQGLASAGMADAGAAGAVGAGVGGAQQGGAESGQPARQPGSEASVQPLVAPALLHLRDELLIEWLEALPERVDAAAMGGMAVRQRLVQKACELMLRACGDHSGGREAEPPSMLTVCREVGASRRKLNYCFQDVLGTSPVKYLRAVRLNGVRRALRDAAPGTLTVQDAAARWGFWHMGQFSCDYRAQFGERPSETLRRL